ncbi:head-tail adaptor protein [Achromobacter sp. UBA4530]|uniref:head-tail adaptor protein n=1 Tax=Achromobacter sp. UBA4530 TaxID=1945912 RepID=UPI00257C4A55|nr:head-tail adaptor protein [Achromobacter sp. UBA4530]
MLAYRLRHRVSIEELITFKGPDGRVESWQTLALDSDTVFDAVPAEVLTGPGREVIASGAPQETGVARVAIRWFPISDERLGRCRLVWNGRAYRIESVETDRTARQEWRFRAVADKGRGV